MRSPLAALLLSLLVSLTAAADPQLVADLRPDGAVSSSPRRFGSDGRNIYFVADDEEPAAFWRTDGTPEGTHILRTTFPPHIGSVWLDPRFTASGDVTYFIGDTNSLFLQLWRTDGTDQGTIPLVTWGPDDRYQVVELTPVASGRLVFTLKAPEGNSLWVSDGTPEGTRTVPNINDASKLMTDGALAYFLRTSSTSTTAALWVTDGTAAGTHAVESFPQSQTTLLGHKAFVFYNELSAGTPSTARLNLSIDAAPARATFASLDGVTLSQLMTGPERLLFSTLAWQGTKRELWTSDGTAAGTKKLMDLAADMIPGKILGRLFFFTIVPAGDGPRQLWRSDGTAAGTFLLAEDTLGFVTLGSSSRQLFFLASSAEKRGLWVSDGTIAGTRRISDIRPLLQGAWTVARDTLYFGGFDGEETELWMSEGTPETTRRIAELADDTRSAPDAFAQLGNILLFRAQDTAHGVELWRTDGTASGTTFVMDAQPGTGNSYPDGFVSMGSFALFANEESAHGRELWRTDGTAEGTRLVRDIYVGGQGLPARGRSRVPRFFVHDGIAYFAARSGSTSGLWRSDGTDGGTFLLKEGGLMPPAVYGSSVVFGSQSGLWKTDGSLAGTTQLTAGASDSYPTVVGSRLFFFRDRQLWLIDAPGAAPHAIVGAPGPSLDVSTGDPLNIALGDLFLVLGFDAAHGVELWRSDGTGPGTRLLKDIFPGSAGSILMNVTNNPVAIFDSRLYFDANDGVHGFELWSTDGTEAGTRMVADLAAGNVDSWPEEMVVSGGKLWFSAFDSEHGRELWSLKGTELTRYDINPGRSGSGAAGLYPWGGAIWFRASTPATGSELWKMQTTPAPPRRRAAGAR